MPEGGIAMQKGATVNTGVSGGRAPVAAPAIQQSAARVIWRSGTEQRFRDRPPPAPVVAGLKGSAYLSAASGEPMIGALARLAGRVPQLGRTRRRWVCVRTSVASSESRAISRAMSTGGSRENQTKSEELR